MIRRRAGFTLLEVLAAALIMALFYGVLTAKGVEGFAIEGDADRRLRASLVADRYLTDLETAVANGTPPRVGSHEQQEDRFAIRLDVSPLEIPLAALQGDTAEPASGSDRRRSRREAEEPPSLLEPGQGQASPVLQMRVTVGWHDGVSDHFVERTTFAIDPEAVAGILDRAGLSGATDSEGNPIFGNATGDGSSGDGSSADRRGADPASRGFTDGGMINNRQRFWNSE